MSYTAIVLSEVSRNLLIEKTKQFVPDGWDTISHHCTLYMGPAKDNSIVGKHVAMVVDSIAINDKVIAVKLCKGGDLSENTTPHVTVAVNRANGGKPFMSNSLSQWQKIPFISLVGVVKRCE